MLAGKRESDLFGIYCSNVTISDGNLMKLLSFAFSIDDSYVNNYNY